MVKTLNYVMIFSVYYKGEQSMVFYSWILSKDVVLDIKY